MHGATFKLFALKGSATLGASTLVMSLNKKAFDALHEPKALEKSPSGALERVVGQAADWFERYLEAEST